MTNETKPSEPVTYRDEQRGPRWWKKFSIHRPGFDVLTGFCLLLVTVHLLIEFRGGMIEHPELYTEWLGLSLNGMTEFKIWQLFSYSFLHGDWFHLLTNLLLIWMVGGYLIVILGQRKMLLALMFTTLSGAAFFLLFELLAGNSRSLVGASGGAIGLFILMAMLDPQTKLFPIPVKAINMAVGLLSSSLLLALLDVAIVSNLFEGASLWLGTYQFSVLFSVAHSCHFGGGIAGFWMSKMILGEIVTLEQLKRARIG